MGASFLRGFPLRCCSVPGAATAAEDEEEDQGRDEGGSADDQGRQAEARQGQGDPQAEAGGQTCQQGPALSVLTDPLSPVLSGRQGPDQPPEQAGPPAQGNEGQDGPGDGGHHVLIGRFPGEELVDRQGDPRPQQEEGQVVLLKVLPGAETLHPAAEALPAAPQQGRGRRGEGPLAQSPAQDTQEVVADAALTEEEGVQDVSGRSVDPALPEA